MTLADTHTILWMTHEQDLLSKPAQQALAEAGALGGIAISDISLWEIAMLDTKRRILLEQPLTNYLRYVESIFVILRIDTRIAERSMQFTKTFPSDPADRVIAATAIVHGLKLVTKDAGIRASKEVECVW